MKAILGFIYFLFSTKIIKTNRKFSKPMQKLKIVILFLFSAIVSVAQNSSLAEFLKAQAIVKETEVIAGNSFFNETYQIMVRQPLDHSDTTKGFFLQRVFVADKGSQNAVLLITEGYGADYAASPRYINELSPMLNSNQICVEHRYFGKSWPSPVNWDYLTVQQVAEDHHAIVELFKKYYLGKWINTGISKGGQTAVYHRAFFPEDVDVTVAYVAPLNFAVEDGRHEPFIAKNAGTAEQREKIKHFQLEVLKNRESILPKLKQYSDEEKYTYRISMDEVLDYCVLEYPFALWQWGRNTDQIPGSGACQCRTAFRTFNAGFQSIVFCRGRHGRHPVIFCAGCPRTRILWIRYQTFQEIPQH